MAVRADGRRKRTNNIQVTIEISNPPHDLDVSSASDLTPAEMQAIVSQVIDTYQLGALGAELGE